MGEPLHNIDNVLKASAIMVDEQGLQFSPRKVTVSTSGLVPQIKRFLQESSCALAVSLNATTDEVKSSSGCCVAKVVWHCSVVSISLYYLFLR